jgi:integrase
MACGCQRPLIYAGTNDLRWDQVDLKAGRLHINRLKHGNSATHYLEGDESRLLRRLRKEYPDSPFLFSTERGGSLTRSTVNKLTERAGRLADLSFPAHPHMLRHAWVCLGEQGGGYTDNSGLPGAQEYPAYRSVYAARATPFSRALALTFSHARIHSHLRCGVKVVKQRPENPRAFTQVEFIIERLTNLGN